MTDISKKARKLYRGQYSSHYAHAKFRIFLESVRESKWLKYNFPHAMRIDFVVEREFNGFSSESSRQEYSEDRSRSRCRLCQRKVQNIFFIVTVSQSHKQSQECKPRVYTEHEVQPQWTVIYFATILTDAYLLP